MPESTSSLRRLQGDLSVAAESEAVRGVPAHSNFQGSA